VIWHDVTQWSNIDGALSSNIVASCEDFFRSADSLVRVFLSRRQFRADKAVRASLVAATALCGPSFFDTYSRRKSFSSGVRRRY